jgi:uncharacterized protein (DUF58 family)
VLAILALVAIFVGITIRNSSLVLVSVPLVAYLTISLVFSNDDSEFNLIVTRFVEKNTIYEDETCQVTLALVNNGSRVDYVEVVDNVSPDFTIINGSNHHIITLGEGEQFSVSYSVKPKVYGYHEFEPIIVKLEDIQETNENIRTYNIKTAIRVLPKIGYIPKINIRPKRTKNWPGEILARRPGSGMEFYSLRDYVPGDPVRRINWNASGRSDERLYTNQFMSELGGDTIIALDARTISEVGKSPASTTAYSIRAAAVIAHRLLRERNRVGMIILGSTLEKVFPAFGKRQFDRILVALSNTKTGDIWEIRGLGRFLSTFFSTMVQIVVISSLNDERAFESIFDVAARGYRVLVISPSPIEIEKKYAPKDKNREYYELGERLLRVQRQNKLGELRQVAIVVDWNVDLPLSEALQEATHQWNRQKIAA